MENQFLTEYLNFARQIKKANYITAIISTDYNTNNIDKLYKSHTKYINSTDTLIATINQSVADGDISSKKAKEINKTIKQVIKSKNSVDKSIVDLNDLFNHYQSISINRNISFVVVFRSGESWNVNFTKSLRSDRSETHAYRFSRSIATKNFLIVGSYPYQDLASITEINAIKHNPSMYGSNINVVCLEEFIDELLYCIFSYKENNDGELIEIKPKSLLSIVNGERGPQIEYFYSSVFNNSKNYELYYSSENEIIKEQESGSLLPNHYAHILDYILDDLKINKSELESVSCDPVGKSLGKADIIIHLTLKDSSIYSVGISIKSSSMDSVSIHERHAADFIKELSITDNDVKDALIQFEKKKAFGKMDKHLLSALTDFFKDETHKLDLVTWAVSGEASSPLKADYVLLHSYVYNSNEALGHAIRIITCTDYIDEIMSSDAEGSLGTHLTWTYKSNIQLNAPFSI